MALIVDPFAKRIAVHRPDKPAILLDVGQELDGGDVLPGFRMKVADAFSKRVPVPEAKPAPKRSGAGKKRRGGK